MKKRTVLSMEQALAMPYATLRFVHLGWRVIRLEATDAGAGGQPGDPNRYIGKPITSGRRNSYYIGPNLGKEAIALNLKMPEGREALKRIVKELDVEVFCCNTVPNRYKPLGIDYETLSAVRPDLIWAGISAMGPDYPDRPGYDPVIQAMVGYMEVTGDASGPPTLSGIPVVDLKAGDEVYANVLLAMAEKAETGKGKRIDVSMLQAASSWLITLLPLIDMECQDEEITRWGNAHRKFIPSNVYPCRDGFIYMALGSNVQWQRLTAIEKFAALKVNGRRDTADGRYRDRDDIYRELGGITSRHTRAEVAKDFSAAGIPNAGINNIRQVHELSAIRSKMTETRVPGSNMSLRLPPMPVDLETSPRDFPFPPDYGQHTRGVLTEVGFTKAEIEAMFATGVAAGG